MRFTRKHAHIAFGVVLLAITAVAAVAYVEVRRTGKAAREEVHQIGDNIEGKIDAGADKVKQKYGEVKGRIKERLGK